MWFHGWSFLPPCSKARTCFPSYLNILSQLSQKSFNLKWGGGRNVDVMTLDAIFVKFQLKNKYFDGVCAAFSVLKPPANLKLFPLLTCNTLEQGHHMNSFQELLVQTAFPSTSCSLFMNLQTFHC